MPAILTYARFWLFHDSCSGFSNRDPIAPNDTRTFNEKVMLVTRIIVDPGTASVCFAIVIGCKTLANLLRSIGRTGYGSDEQSIVRDALRQVVRCRVTGRQSEKFKQKCSSCNGRIHKSLCCQWLHCVNPKYRIYFGKDKK